MIYSNAGRIAEPLEQRAQTRAETALLLMDGKRLLVGPAGVTLGRSRQCDVIPGAAPFHSSPALTGCASGGM